MTSDEEYDPRAVSELELMGSGWPGNLHVISILFISHTWLLQHVCEHIVPFIFFLVY